MDNSLQCKCELKIYALNLAIFHLNLNGANGLTNVINYLAV